MQTLKKVEITPVFLDGYMIPFEDMKDNHIYISEEYMTSTHRCLCGCGLKTVLPLNKPGETFGWNLIKEPKYSKALAAGIAMDNKLRADYRDNGTSDIHFDSANYEAYFSYDKLIQLLDYENKSHQYYSVLTN